MKYFGTKAKQNYSKLPNVYIAFPEVTTRTTTIDRIDLDGIGGRKYYVDDP